MGVIVRYSLDRPPALGRGSCDICTSSVGLGYFFLSPAVTAQLCVVHRDVNFLRRAGGQTFIDAMASHWRADSKDFLHDVRPRLMHTGFVFARR